MSIASEIARLQQAKADIKTAIENKGVTVSSSDKLDDYADLIDSIETGGGGGGGDISSMLTKANLVSIVADVTASHTIETMNSSNNFYAVDWSISIFAVNYITFTFNDISFTWDFPRNENVNQTTYGTKLDEDTKFLILTFGGVSFYVKLRKWGHYLDFYIGDEVVGTVEGLD